MEKDLEKVQILDTVSLKIKFWIKGANEFTLGKGDVKLLKALLVHRNLTKASEQLNYSYKYGWSKLKKISKNSGRDVVITQKGGYGGGGAVELTTWGSYLIQIYDIINEDIENFIDIENEKISKIKFHPNSNK